MATITKRNNTYLIRVYNGYDVTGRQIYASMTYKPKPGMNKKQIEKEVQRQAVLFEEKIHNGECAPGSIKFASFAERWFTDYAEKQLKARTVERYRGMMQRINAAIGHIRLDKLRPMHLVRFYNNLSEDGIRRDVKCHSKRDLNEVLKKRKITKEKLSKLSGVGQTAIYTACRGDNIARYNAEKIAAVLQYKPETLFYFDEHGGKLSDKTIQNYHRLISSILSTAVQWQIITSNPCERIKPPRVVQTEAQYLDDVETVKLLEYLEEAEPQFRTAIILLLYTGMRRAELCGLEWKDVDFNNGLLHIERNSLYLPGRGVFTDTTKNSSSQRVVKLPAGAVELLKAHKAWQNEERLKLGDQWHNCDRIFTRWDGEPMRPDTITNQFREFVKAHDLPPVHLHSLRHTNATLMIAGGMNLTTVAKRLGHANTNTTTKIYAHAIKTAEEAAAEMLDDILNIKKKKTN